MKILALALALLALSAPSTFAIRMASQDEIKEIQDQIHLANRMDKEIETARLRLGNTRDPQEKIYRQLELEREKSKQSAARTKAIHMAILAYDLEPTNRSGTSVMPSTKGRTITWLPVARESESRQTQGKEGNLQDVKQDKKGYVGMTYMDGVTIMDPTAFLRGPGYLASYLLHERTHFEQITTAGKGDVMTYAEVQKEAYQAQVSSAGYFFDPQKKSDLRLMQDIERLRDDEAFKVEQEAKQKEEESKGLKGALRKLLPRQRPPEAFDAGIHTNTELADIKGLVEQARSQADIARRDHDERLKITYADLARRSCANPGSVSQAELDALPRSYGTDVMNTMPLDLGECDGFLYSMILHGTTADQIWARSEQKGPVPLKPESTPTRVTPTIPSNPVPIRGRRVKSFSTIVPLAKDLAVTACGSPDRVTIDSALTMQRSDIGFIPQSDDRIVDELALGLGGCENWLFRRLIEVIRNGEGPGISVRWVQETAAAYRPAPVYYFPPSGGRCEDYGNVRCPH